MKKIILILALIALIFTFAACGNKVKDDIKNEMTTIKNDVTSMMDGVSSAASDIDSSLTSEGNVTKEESSTGLLDEITDEADTTEKDTTDSVTDKTTTVE